MMAYSLTIDDLCRDERSFLLYAETCAVDGGGLLVGIRMNADDHAAADRFQSLGYLRWGRIPSEFLVGSSETSLRPSGVTHWVELTDAGWALAHRLRVQRGDRRGPFATKVFDHPLTRERLATALATSDAQPPVASRSTTPAVEVGRGQGDGL